MTPEERASEVCNKWETPHVPRNETLELDTLITVAIRDAEREAYEKGKSGIVCDETINYDKVEIWKHGKGYRLHIVLKSPVYGDINLFSDFYDGIREADSRAVAVAQCLGLPRDHLPVHEAK